MNKQIVCDLISVVSKSTDKNVIYRALYKLRADIVKDKEGIELFYACKGVPPLVRLISKPYEKILEIALSILGNCCTNKDCCKQAISNGVVPPLLTILKSIPSTSVQCKACRLLGNLARESNEKICNLAKGIGVAIAAVLEDNQDLQCLNMAIRAVRLLWYEMPFNEEFIRSDGIKKIITIIVKITKIDEQEVKSIVESNPKEMERVLFMEEHIKAMESVNSSVFDKEMLKKTKPMAEIFKMPENKIEIDFFIEVFRCLQVVTVGHSMRVLCDFYIDQRGCNCIVSFAQPNSKFREQALKILSNLSRCQNSNQFVSNQFGSITTACSLITQEELDPELTESEIRHCVNIICFLSGDACNRAKIRTTGALKRLMIIAKDTKCDSILSTILIGFQNFKYDNISIHLMIRIGLIDVLIERLDNKTKDLTEIHVRKTNSEIAGGSNSNSNKSSLNDSFIEDNFKLKRMKFDFNPFLFIPTSPSSSNVNNSNPSSPCSSSGLSPNSMSPRNTDNQEDLDSEYSPVCSDIEDNVDDDDANTAEKSKNDSTKQDMSVMKLLEEYSQMENEMENQQPLPMDEDDTEMDLSDKNENTANTTEIRKTVQLIINILTSCSYRMKEASELCKPEALKALVQTCKVAFKRHTNESRWDEQGAPLILSLIVGETNNFVRIIKQNFVFEIYKLTQCEHQDCITCKDLQLVGNGILTTLTDMAENGYGRGEMAHLLLKGEKTLQKQIAVITTYIIKDPKILHRLLVECGALYILMEIILSKDKSLCNEAASGITALSKKLNIFAASYDETKINNNQKYDCTTNYIDNDNNEPLPFVTFFAGETKSLENSIKFNEKLLIECSDVFYSMLNRNFKESKDREILLKNQTINGVRYFLDGIKQITTKQLLNIPDSALIGNVLEAYDMCQIYMIKHLEKELYNLIVFMLNEQTALEIFEFSIKNHKQELTEMAINYYLSANLGGELKVKMFNEADNSNYFKEWNQMMLDTIVYTCQNLIV